MIELNSTDSELLIDLFDDFIKSPFTKIVQINEQVTLATQVNNIGNTKFFVISIYYHSNNLQIVINITYYSIQSLVRKIQEYELIDYMEYVLTIQIDGDMLSYNQYTNGFFVVFVQSNEDLLKSFSVDEYGFVN